MSPNSSEDRPRVLTSIDLLNRTQSFQQEVYLHVILKFAVFLKSFFRQFCQYPILELIFLNKGGTKIIWNLHNLKRHDGKFVWLEKLCFKKLAKQVLGESSLGVLKKILRK